VSGWAKPDGAAVGLKLAAGKAAGAEAGVETGADVDISVAACGVAAPASGAVGGRCSALIWAWDGMSDAEDDSGVDVGDPEAVKIGGCNAGADGAMGVSAEPTDGAAAGGFRIPGWVWDEATAPGATVMGVAMAAGVGAGATMGDTIVVVAAASWAWIADDNPWSDPARLGFEGFAAGTSLSGDCESAGACRPAVAAVAMGWANFGAGRRGAAADEAAGAGVSEAVGRAAVAESDDDAVWAAGSTAATDAVDED
jgi:hypothetical protein